MATYNAEQYLKVALQSVLSQSLRDLEVVVVDDGSSDATRSILDASAEEDSRLRWVANDQNSGLAFSLNRALRMAEGERVARMDHDDICHPRRLEIQDRFLSERPELLLCGSMVRVFGEGMPYTLTFPTGAACVRASLLFNNPLAHPSVMFARNPVKELDVGYDESVGPGQDYALWSQLLVSQDADNVPAPLLRYRVHRGSVSRARSEVSFDRRMRLQREHLERLGFAPSEDDLSRHERIGNGVGAEDLAELTGYAEWLRALLAANQKSASYPESALRSAISFYWYRCCLNSVRRVPEAQRMLGSFYDSTLTHPIAAERFRFVVNRLRGLLRI